MDMNLSKLQEMVKEREVWRAAVPGVAKSRTRLSDQTTNRVRVLKTRNQWEKCWDVTFHDVQLEGLPPCRGGWRRDEMNWGHFLGDFIPHSGWLGWKEILKCIVLWRGSCSTIHTKRGAVIKCKVQCFSPAQLTGTLDSSDFNLKCEARSCWSMKRGNQGAINRRAPQMIESSYCIISFDLFPQPTFDKKTADVQQNGLMWASSLFFWVFCRGANKDLSLQTWAVVRGLGRVKEPALCPNTIKAFSKFCLLLNLFLKYLFIWLCWVLVVALRIFCCGMYDLIPWPGIEPWPLHWELRVLATGPLGKSQILFIFQEIIAALKKGLLMWIVAFYHHLSC